MSVSSERQQTWTNWAGNQRFTAAEIAAPTSEAELIELVRQAAAARRPMGIVGSAHSFTPIVETSDLLIRMEGVNGVLSRNPEQLTADVLAGTTIKQMGGELWDVGLSVKNQGDIDKQTIAGAIATGTHGSASSSARCPLRCAACGSSPARATCSTSTTANPTSCTQRRCRSDCSGW